MDFFTAYLAPAKPPRREASADLQAAVDAYNRDHGRDWGRTGGTCPVCGHHGCFGPAGGKLRNTGRWACFSANHGNVGRKVRTERGTAACMAGDALDVDAYQAGRARVEHLRATGYLKDPARTHQSAPDAREPLQATRNTSEIILGHSGVPSLTEYETEWLEEMAGRLEFDDTLDYTRETAYAEAQRRLRQIQDSEKGASHA